MDPLFLFAAAVVVLVIAGLTIRGSARSARRRMDGQPHTSTPATTTVVTAPAALSAEVTTEIDRLVEADQRIQAIKVYRDHTGARLREAKEAIDDWSISTTGSPSPTPRPAASATPSTIRATIPAEIAAEIDALVARDQKIAAIKTLREHTRLGLQESKDLIDVWPTSHNL